MSDQTMSERVSQYRIISEQAAFAELGRRIGYLISTSKLEEAAITAQFQSLLLLMMQELGLNLDDAIDKLWTEHKELMDKLPIPDAPSPTMVHDLINRGKILMDELQIPPKPNKYIKHDMIVHTPRRTPRTRKT